MSGNNQANVQCLTFTNVVKKNLRFEDHITSSTQTDLPEKNRSLLLLLLLLKCFIIKINKYNFVVYLQYRFAIRFKICFSFFN